MTAIAAANVTYTPPTKGIGVNESGTGRSALMKIVFGNSTLTYPTNGIPLSNLSANGFPTVVTKVTFEDASVADSYMYKWDSTNNTIRIYYGTASHTHSLYVATGATDATGARANAATNSFAMNNAAATIAGIPAASGAAGGIVNAAASAGSEVPTSFAPAATTIWATVSGY